MWNDVPGAKAVVESLVSRHLARVAADSGATERAESLAALVSTARVALDAPQLSAIR